jgi:acetylglutamate kinase
MNKLTRVKVGGKIVEEPQSLKQLVTDFSKIEEYFLNYHTISANIVIKYT